MCTLYINLWFLAIHYEYLMISRLRIWCLPFSELICIYIIAHNISLYLHILYRYFFYFRTWNTTQHNERMCQNFVKCCLCFWIASAAAKSWTCLYIHNSIIVFFSYSDYEKFNKYLYLKSNNISGTEKIFRRANEYRTSGSI